MIKKILNKKEKEIFDYTVRPFTIYCVVVAIIIIIGSNIGSVSSDTVDGYINSMVIVMLINHINMSYIELKKNIKKKWNRNFKTEMEVD